LQAGKRERQRSEIREGRQRGERTKAKGAWDVPAVVRKRAGKGTTVPSTR
jgi:hypothetical protein